MQSFKAATPLRPLPPPHPFLNPLVQPTNSDMFSGHSPFFLRGGVEESGRTRFSDLGELLQHSAGFHQVDHDDTVDLSPNTVVFSNSFKSSSSSGNVAAATVLSNNNNNNNNNLQFVGLNSSISSAEMGSSGTGAMMDTGQQQFMLLNAAVGNGNFDNWGDSAMAENTSQHTDTSTDVDTDDHHQFRGIQHGALAVADSMDQPSKGKNGDQKMLRRLAQNREAARKSRLRKKAYVQQLENSRLKLTQLEQELQQARQQGIFMSTGFVGDQSHPVGGNVALAFDMDYARWIDEHQRLINDLRSALNSHLGDNELRLLVEGVMSHYDEIFRLKSMGAKSDVFHMLSGMWKTPAERCFMWLGGFRSSELLKIVGNHLEPLTDQQLMGICNLQQSSQQAEDALSQGMEALQQSLVDTLSSASLGPAGSGNVADYMGQMAIAMGKLATLENFLHQADLLRQQTLQQLHRILTTRQAARALLVISDYMSRLRALSSLWLARPKD